MAASTLATNHPQRRPQVGFRSYAAHLVLLLASAFLLALSFPRFGWWGFAHIALVPLTLLATRSTQPKRLIGLSYIVGVLWWLWMIRWMVPITGGGYVVMCFILGLYWAAATWGIRQLYQAFHLPMVVVVPLVWVSLEFIRGHVIAGGFMWFNLSHAMAPWKPTQQGVLLIQIADFGGEWVVSLLVAMTNGMLVDVITRPLLRAGRRLRPDAGGWAYLIWLAAMSFTLMYGVWRTKQVTTGKTIPIAIVQTNVLQNNKQFPTTEKTARDWQWLQNMTKQIASQAVVPKLIVWPETMVPAAINREAANYYQNAPTNELGYQVFREQIIALSKELNCSLLVGAHAKFDWQIKKAPDGREFMWPSIKHNAAYLITPQATSQTILPRYDKIHLVPFGEYIPWVASMPALKTKLMSWFSPYAIDYSLTPGKERTLFNLPLISENPKRNPLRIVTPICFEVAIPRVTRKMVYQPNGQKRAEVIVNLTNDGWYAGTSEPIQHLQIATLRCVENRVPMVRAVNRGVSAFIDAYGRVQRIIETDGKIQQISGAATWQVKIDGRQTFFGKFGELPIKCLLWFSCILIFVAAVKNRKLKSRFRPR